MNLLNNATINVPKPTNEPILSYAPGSEDRTKLKATIADLSSQIIEIPLVIGGKRIYTGNTVEVTTPYDHTTQIAIYHKAGAKEVQMAIDAAMGAKKRWSALRWEERCGIFLKAAELLATKYRYKINAGAMLAGAKTAFQAEIDAACELIDFLRYNVYYAQQIYADQPTSSKGVWNFLQHRPLEGFVFAVAPFNFTAIAGNLPTAPAIMGNTIVWKPASSLTYTPYFFMEILEEAGIPAGVINFVPGAGREVGDVCLASPDLAGIHYTGSTKVFQSMWKTVGNNIEKYKAYPRIVGETGGKDFIFAHPTAAVPELVAAMVRGSFEYQGQKCSAASRAYIPESLWPAVKEGMVQTMAGLKMGPVTDFTNFLSAVIDQGAFDSIKKYIDYAKTSDECEIVAGGNCDDSVGYYIEPTVIKAQNPKFKTMVEEVFGPVLTVYVYKDDEYSETLELCDTSSIYALTGAIFAQDREAVSLALSKLENSAGNFYINDKPTGAVVGQQPFGGGRASGTNDKAGAQNNMVRWASPRTIKETFVAPTEVSYPFMDES